MTNSTYSSFREDIQVFRAISVLAVVGYHAGWGVRSGFIGVDLFFVISGFVISGLLMKELRVKGNINIINFYIRRIYRLLPALGFMVFIISILSFLLISPFGMQQNAAKTGIGALLASANLVITTTTKGYFDLPSQFNIFLHTWSLSVEEQFYFIFPVLIALFAVINKKHRKKLMFFCISLVFLISIFDYSHYSDQLLDNSVKLLSGFYSPITRAWEFLIGAFVQLMILKKPISTSHRHKSIVSSIILSLLLGTLFLPEKTFQYPTLSIIVPIILLATLLYLGNHKNMTPVLNSRSLIYIGDRSYAIYLWHWPLIVFAKHVSPESSGSIMLAIILTMLISIVTFRFIENPIRKTRDINLNKISKLCIQFLLVPILISGLLGYVSSQMLSNKYNSDKVLGHYPGEIGTVGFNQVSSLIPKDCKNTSSIESISLRNCGIDVIIAGDSHSKHLLPGFRQNFPQIRFAVIGDEIYDIEKSTIGKTILDEINANKSIKIIVFNSYWAKKRMLDGLNLTLKSLSENGKLIIVLDGTPDFPFDAFTCKFGISAIIKYNICSSSSSRFERLRSRYYSLQQKELNGIKNTELIVTSNLYCRDGKCSMIKNRELHYFDSNHLNSLGSRFITNYIGSVSKNFQYILPR
jgi:peptidoglycan/LPS O-acetylase OafA/YrhL